MSRGQGFTLLEILVVLIIAGIAAALFFPNYNIPTEQARAATTRNNLLAIYSAEQNYYNSNGSYCTSSTNPNPCDSLSDINTALSLNIPDDGTYVYNCVRGSLTNTCTATRNNGQSDPLLTLYLGQAIPLVSPSGPPNPQCYTTNNRCP